MIVSARYQDADARLLCMTFDDGSQSVIDLTQDGYLAGVAKDWLDAGHTPDPYEPLLAPAPQFLARDLIDLLTTDDLTAIEAAVAQSTPLRLLWVRLRSRGEKPVAVDSEAFQQGWAGLQSALGETRASEIATALGFGEANE